MPQTLSHPIRLSAAALALGALIAAAGLAVAAPPAHAASFTVTTTADGLDAGSCGVITQATLPGPDGLISLREAVCAANNTSGADTINLPAGTYTLTGSAGEDSGATGDLDVMDGIFSGAGFAPGDGLTVIGDGAASTIIDGAGLDRIFDVWSFDEFDLSVRDVTLRDGDAGTADGGALQFGFGGSAQLFDVVIEGSSAANGGAIANIQGQLTMFGTVLRNNTATSLGGGVYSVGVLLMQATTVTGNTAANGGGLALQSGGSDVSTIEQSTISSNQATTRGGGILLDGSHNGMTTVSNTTIVDNVAAVDGGAVYSAGTVGQVGLYSTTITGNASAGVGGIMRTAGFADLEDSIVAENSGADVSGTWTATGNIVGVAGGGVVDGAAGNRAGTAVAPLDPELRPLGLYGETTQVRVPMPGSPAIDTGLSCPAVDQRMLTRDALCDVGAVELTAAPETSIASGPAFASATGSATFAFAGSGGTGPYTFECRLGAGAFAACASPRAFSGLADGTQSFAVRAIDAYGATDASAAVHAWTITTPATELAATGADQAAGLLAGALGLLFAGALLVAVRVRQRRA